MTIGGEGQVQLVHSSYRQLHLAPMGVSPIYDGRDTGPLVSITNDATALIIITGCADGPVFVAVRQSPGPPPAASSWDVQESVSIIIDDALYLSSPTWSKLYDPVLVPVTPGPHRLRISARGRRGNVDLSVATPTEHYLVEAWPDTSLRMRETTRDDGAGI